MISKTNLVTLGVLLLSAMILAVSPCAQVKASEPTLEAILDSLGFTYTATTVETFPAGMCEITLYAEHAGYSDQNTLSWYKTGTSDYNQIFDGPDSPQITESFMATMKFGLSLLSPDGRWFTETARNTDGKQQAKVYQNLDDPNMFLIGFENLEGGGDADFNDMVISLKCLPAVGGFWSPVNKLELISPWIGTISLILSTVVISAVYTKHKKKL